MYNELRPSHMVLKLSDPGAPVIFIDNQPGYVPVESLTKGRMSEGVSWGNTKYCMGYTFFATDSEIGVGIVKEGNIYAITTSRVEDFFRISFEGGESETSLVCVIQVDYDKILVCAVTMFNNELAYASSVISARGLAVALTTKIDFPGISDSEKEKYSNYFNEDGSSNIDTTPPNSGDMIVTYETYNESSSFGHISSITGVTERSSDAMIKVMSCVQDDIYGISSSFSKLDNAISMESSVHKDDIFIIMTSVKSVKVNKFNGISFEGESRDFETETCLSVFDNVHQSNIIVKTPEKWALSKNHNKIYSPSGVFFRYNTFSGIVVFFPEDKIMKSYFIGPPREEEDEIVDWSSCVDNDDKLISSNSVTTNMACSDMSYTLGGHGVFMNSGEAIAEEIMAKIDGTKIRREDMNGTVSKAIKSMSTYIPYMTQG